MSQYVAEVTAAVEIERREQLIEPFLAGAKTRDQWRVGTEYEKVVVRSSNGHAAPFSGPSGIETLLRRMADRYGWEPVEEDGRVVALRGPLRWITLEPGGQLELSGALCDNIHMARAEFEEHVEQIMTVGQELDLTYLGLGMQPVSRLHEIEWVPKRRYRIMGPYMLEVGNLGQRMMKQTAGVQVNLDYSSEADAMKKFRIGMGLVPLLTAIFANSPISDGRPNGYRSFRAHIWTDTDDRRCGLLPFAFSPEASFEHYVDHALDVPMYFIVRGDEWFNLTSMTFRQFMKQGHRGHRATVADWHAHLTTLFYEVRLKGYLEVRCADSQPPERILAVPALMKGLFYDETCLDASWDLVKKWSWGDRLDMYHGAHRDGLQARLGRTKLADLARELFEIAREGLRRNPKLDSSGRDESIYLDAADALVRRGVCPADVILENWNGPWCEDMSRLVAATVYRKP